MEHRDSATLGAGSLTHPPFTARDGKQPVEQPRRPRREEVG